MSEFWNAVDSAIGWNVGLFVHIATLGYVLGFLFKNQITLRLLVLVATVSYIVYYYAFPEEPLWGAIFGSILIMCANLTGLARLLYDRLPLRIDPRFLQIYKSLPELEPGEFRRLMKIGKLLQADAPVALTERGIKPEYLYYIIEGKTVASKGREAFELPSSRFIGEVSFVLNGPATAKVVLQKGSYVRWNRKALEKELERNPKFQHAFESLIGRDLARKVAVSEPKTYVDTPEDWLVYV